LVSPADNPWIQNQLFESFADNDFMDAMDFYSALFLVIGGFAALIMLQVLRWFSARQMLETQDFGNPLESLILRFEERRRWSWACVLVGSLWLVQLVIEQRLGL
jgi:hypothetical protein